MQLRDPAVSLFQRTPAFSEEGLLRLVFQTACIWYQVF